MMEVTEEMIKAVQAHQRAEAKRKEDEARQERLRRYRETEARLRASALSDARKIFPDMTEAQFDELQSCFHAYFEAEQDNW